MTFPGAPTYPGAGTFPGGPSPSPSRLATPARYTDQGTTRIYFLPSIADPALVPTRAELSAGTDLSGEISDISGWTTDIGRIAVLTLGSRFQSSIPGAGTINTSSLTMYNSKTGEDARSLLSRGTTGYIVMCDGGDTIGNLAEVHPVLVASTGMRRTMTGKEASKVIINFAVTSRPAAVILPAALFPSPSLFPSSHLYPA